MPAELTSAGEEVLVYLLKTSGTVAEIIGTRIVPDQIPATWKDQDGVVYEKAGERRQRVVSGATTGLVHEAFTIYCISRRRDTSRILAAAVRAALTVNGSATIAGVRVRQVFVKDGERDESLPAADGQETPERYRTLDVIVHHRT